MTKPNFYDRILSAIGLQRTRAAIPLIAGIANDPFTIWAMDKKISAERAMRLYNGWVYACVRAIAEGISQIDFRLFKIKQDGSSEEIFEHELLDLLHGVNPFQTGSELKYHTAAHLELTGNSYWYLEGVKKETDKPKAIYVLNPKHIKVNKQPLPVFITGYKHQIGAQTQDFQPYEILHFSIPDPNDPYEGIGTVQGALEWITADNFATKLNENYFKNGARLSGVLESSIYTTPEQLDYIKKSFMQLYSGAENAYQVAAMPEGTKFTSMSDTPKEMDFVNLQFIMRDKILSAFRVPKTILGTAESETNRATAETAKYIFAERTLKPKMQMIVSQLNEFLVPRYGDDLYLEFTDPTPENRELAISEMAAATGHSPVLSPNEARERYFGVAPLIKGGDSLLAPFNLAPIGEVEKSTQPARLGTKNHTSGTSKRSTRFARSATTRKEIAAEIVKAAAEAMKELETKANELKKTAINEMTDEEFEVIYKQFAFRVDAYEKKMREMVRDFDAMQKKEVLANIEAAIQIPKAKAIDPKKLFNEDAYVASFINLATPILMELYAKEGVAAAELIGQTLRETDILTPQVRQAISESIELLSQSYNQETLTLLKEKLTQGIAEGASMLELKDIVSQVYEFNDEIRAEKLARTEAFRIANEATKQAWKATGVVKTLKWYSAEDERVCLTCAPMHGKIIGIDENFYEKGDTVEGDDGTEMRVDYADIGAPPLHPNCRCYIRPEEISLGQPPAETKEKEVETKKVENEDDIEILDKEIDIILKQ